MECKHLNHSMQKFRKYLKSTSKHGNRHQNLRKLTRAQKHINLDGYYVFASDMPVQDTDIAITYIKA